MAIELEKIKPWDGQSGTGADNRGVIDRNFDKVKDELESIDTHVNTKFEDVEDEIVQLAGEDMLLNERYAYEAKEFNDDGIVSSATVIWKDGTSGILTFSDYNDDWQAYDSYEITCGDKTLVQPKVARDEQGNIIDKPLKNIQ